MPDKPNILVILLDTARAKNFKFYGYERDTTPYLTSCVKKGEFEAFNDFYSNSIWSLPNYASFFTGKLPCEHGAIDWNSEVDQNILIRNLKNRGYQTKAITTNILDMGFGMSEEFHNVKVIDNTPPSSRYFWEDPILDKINQMENKGEFDSQYQKYIYFLKLSLENKEPKTLFNGFYSFYAKLKQKIYKKITPDDKGGKEIVESFKKDDFSYPFFQFINFIEPHQPHRLPCIYTEQISKERLDKLNEADWKKLTLGIEEEKNWMPKTANYLHDQELKYVDERIEEMINHLKDQGKYSETAIIIFSDHGDLFGKNGIWGHTGEIHEELVHTPLLIKWPKNLGSEKVKGPISPRKLFSLLEDISKNKNPKIDDKPVFVEYYGFNSSSELNLSKENVNEEFWNRYQCAAIQPPLGLFLDSLNNQRLVLGRQKEAKNKKDFQKLRKAIYRRIGKPSEIQKRYRKSSIGEIDV